MNAKAKMRVQQRETANKNDDKHNWKTAPGRNTSRRDRGRSTVCTVWELTFDEVESLAIAACLSGLGAEVCRVRRQALHHQQTETQTTCQKLYTRTNRPRQCRNVKEDNQSVGY